MRKTILIFSCCAFFALAAMAQRTEALLEKNWKFTKGDVPEAIQGWYGSYSGCGL